METWKTFSANVLRSLPANASAADHARALKAAGKMWRGETEPMAMKRRTRRNPEMPMYGKKSGSKTLMYVGAAALAYYLLMRPHMAQA